MRLCAPPAATWVTPPVAPGKLTSTGTASKSQSVAERDRPSPTLPTEYTCPPQLASEYSCPVAVTTRLVLAPAATWITRPVAPGKLTRPGVGFGKPDSVTRPNCPYMLLPNEYSCPVDVTTR